jgi:spore maturation protein CgeB
MIKVMRDAGTDYLFAGLLAKELESRPFPVDLELWIEPRGKGDIYFTQDGSCEKKDNVKFCFYTQPSEREKMTELFGKNCALVTYAADPEIHKQIPCEKIYDVGFIGKPHGDDRDDYLDALRSSGLKVFISEDTPGKDVALKLSQCKVLFNHIRFVDVNLRFFEAMAIGCQLVNRKPGIEEFAKEDIHYLGYSSPKEMLDKLEFLLANTDVRNKLTVAARSHFLSNHTYAHRATSIINHLKEYLCLPQ